MLNFDFKITVKNNTYEIRNNSLELLPTQISAPNVNKIIEAYVAKINSFLPKGLNGLSFDELLKDMRYLEDAFISLVALKQSICFGGKTFDDFKSETIAFRGKIYDTINKNLYSKVEVEIIYFIKSNNKPYLYFDEVEYYKLATEDKTILNNLEKNWNNFNWKKFEVLFPNLNNLKEYAQDKFKILHENINNLILFKRKFSPEVLVNFGKIKITKEMKLLNFNEEYFWSCRRIIDAYKEHLLASGVKLKVVKECKNNIDRFKKSNQGDISNVIEKMSIQEIYTLIDSDLKCITEKVTTHSDSILDKLNSVAPSQENWNYLIKFVNKYHLSEKLDLTIFNLYVDYATLEEFQTCVTNNTYHSFEVSEELYEKIISKFQSNFKLNSQVSFELISRMSTQEKIFLLNEEDLIIDYKHYPILFKDVKWEILREKVIKSSTLIKYFRDVILEKKDIEAAKIYLKLEDNSSLVSLLSYEDKIEVLINLKNSYRSHYLDWLFTQEELLRLLSQNINTKYIFKSLDIKYLNEVQNILNNNVINIFYLTSHSLKFIHNNVPLKLKLLPSISLTDLEYLFKRDIKISSLLQEFFSNFTRKDVDENGLMYQYRIYLAHTMTQDELIEMANKSNGFLRYNLDFIPLRYLLQFKDPNRFKEVVGSRVHRENKVFAAKLLERLKIPQSIEFLLED